MKTDLMLNTFRKVFKKNLEEMMISYNAEMNPKLTFAEFSAQMFHSGVFRTLYPTPKNLEGIHGRELAKMDREKGSAFNLLMLLFAKNVQFKDYVHEAVKDFELPKNFLLCIPRFRVQQLDEMHRAIR